MAPLVSFRITGVRETIVALQAEVAALAPRAVSGLLAAGKIVEKQAKENVAPYRYEGRLARSITTWVAVKTPTFVEVKVGIRGNTFAPEGKTFEVGWRSKRGLQPPTAPIAEWVHRRGIASGPDVQHVAFAIARAQGRRGYSFGERHWLSDAWQSSQFQAAAVLERYMVAFWATQPRVPAGQSGGGRFLAFS